MLNEPARIRAISLHQPWAQAIVTGAKTIETRGWSTDYRGPLVIHAAKKWKKVDMDYQLAQRPAWRVAFQEIFNELGPDAFLYSERVKRHMPLGCLVAICNLYDCKPTEMMNRNKLWEVTRESDQGRCCNENFGDFSPERFAWTLTDIRPLPAPIPWLGRQSFFTVPGFTIEQILQERQSQIDCGYTLAHDDLHFNGEIKRAGQCYLNSAEDPYFGIGPVPREWPFESESWNPNLSPAKNFIKGAAMMLAEQERIERLTPEKFYNMIYGNPGSRWNRIGEKPGG